METNTALALLVMVVGYASVSGLVKRWYIAPALIFMLLGMMLGPFGFGVLDVGPGTSGFTVLAQLALTAILFNQAADIDLSAVLRRGHASFRLVIIGIPLTIALGALTALLVLPVLPLWEAVCLGAIVAPSEVALIDALLEDKRIPERVRHALSVESGCYDGFALAALLAALALDSHRLDDASSLGWVLVRSELVSLGVGAAIGLVGALVLVHARRRNWVSGTWAQLATMAVALACFAVGERLHASGFVAAFAGGLAYAYVARRTRTEVPRQFSEAVGQLLELMVFAMFGGYAVITGWRDASWRVVLFAVLAVVVVRLVAVGIALLGTDLPKASRAFIGWFGPRGIGTLVLGLLVIESGHVQQESLITQAVVVAITVSLVLHSLTAPLGIRLVSGDRLMASDPKGGPVE